MRSLLLNTKLAPKQRAIPGASANKQDFAYPHTMAQSPASSGKHQQNGTSMRIFTIALVALGLSANTVLAQECTVEDRTHRYTAPMQLLVIDGVTNCKTGMTRFQIYDGEGEAQRLLGVETAYIKGRIFKALTLQALKPSALSIRYSIDPE